MLTTIIGASFGLYSCNITNPSAYINKSAHAPVLSQIAVHGVQPGQAVHGTITVSIDSLPPTLKVWKVELYESDTLRSGAYGPPYNLTLDTRNLPGGLDTLVINILLAQDSTLGLLNGLILTTSNDLRFSLSIPVVVNNSLPGGPQNVSCVWNSYPVLSWSPSQDQDFRAYIVHRYWPGALVDTIFDRATTSFSDQSIQPVYGSCVGYTVSIWNGYSESASDSVYLVHGTMLSKPGIGVFLAASPNLDEAYLATVNASGQTAEYLRAFSTITDELTDSLPSPIDAVHLSLSSDGSIISYFDLNSHAIKRLSVSGFNPLPDITIGSYGDYPSAIAVARDRIVISTIYGDLDMFDAATGKLIDLRKQFFTSNSLPLLVSAPNSDTVFAAIDGDLYEINAGFDTLSVMSHRVYAESIQNLATVPGTDLLAVQLHDYVDLDQMSGLSTQTTLAYQNRQILAMSFAGGKAYIGTPVPSSGGGTPQGFVTEFNIGNVAPVRSWTFETSSNMRIAVARDDNTMYVTNFEFGPKFQGYGVSIVNLK